ncbi:hypothetical protein [Endozoicomonas elysicola]|uniref:hypothetical protein n=1 Tax=Endozoicomonas elysicola TaxID=305900 RepID=UPI000367C2C9|nr:hypothetical protein [Endozoicomonas elysicola]
MTTRVKKYCLDEGVSAGFIKRSEEKREENSDVDEKLVITPQAYFFIDTGV